jgi:uncharacterized membrane protein
LAAKYSIFFFMNESDKRIKKQWLIIWGLCLLISTISSFLYMRYNPFLNGISQILYASFLFLGTLGWNFALYYCIYKKPGTKLVTFCLILTALSLATNLFLYLTGRLPLQHAHFPYYKTLVLTSQGIGVLWMVACWRMRRLNKKLQVQSILSL